MVLPTETSTISLAELLPSLSLANGDMVVRGITLDSRKVEPGFVFVALKGLSVDGRNFIPQAISAGACAILVEEMVENEFHIPIFKIEQLEKKLSVIAGRFYGQPSQNIPVIGVTGTNGKTTCTQLIAQAYAQLQQCCGVIGTMGYGIFKQDIGQQEGKIKSQLHNMGMTTPDAISTQRFCGELVKQGAQVLALEVSSHALEQSRVAGLSIDTAVFTNLSHEHLDYHGTMESYLRAKVKLFSMHCVKNAVVNKDDNYYSQIVAVLNEGCRLITYSLVNPSAHFYLDNIQWDTSVGLIAVLHTPEGDFSISTSLLGSFNLSNLLAVIASLYANGVEMKSIVSLIPRLNAVTGRMEQIQNTLDLRVVVDYAHTPDALKNTLQALKFYTRKKLWCVFGCGGDRDREKRPKMANMAESYANKIVVTSDNPRTESNVQIFADIEKGFQVPRDVIADRGNAIEYAITEAEAGDTILIAGKGHEDYQLIGKKSFPFSDQQQARFFLRRRESEEDND